MTGVTRETTDAIVLLRGGRPHGLRDGQGHLEGEKVVSCFQGTNKDFVSSTR